MKIKCLILFLVLFFCSGCNIEYTLKIDEQNHFQEEFRLITETSEESEELRSDPFPYKVFYDDPDSGEYPTKLDGVSYYATEILQNGRFYKKRFSYEFLGSQFSRASSVHSCYENFRWTEDSQNGTLTLRTSSKFLCMESYPSITNVTIRVESVKPIVTTNADEVNGNTCIWYINSNNYLERGLILTIQNMTPQKGTEVKSEEKEPVSIWLLLVILGGFLVFLIIIFMYKMKD